MGLAEDNCRISLERRNDTDVLHLRFEEFGSDRDLAYPAHPGTDAEAARAALAAAARSGAFSISSVRAGGLLEAEECRLIIEAGEAAYLRAREQAREEARDAERQQPSRILAVARDLRLVPEPIAVNQWVANCPGANHTIMLGTRSDTFGCGYCKVKGGPDELVAFVARRRAGRASG